MRTNLPDRPGALASLAEQCGLADINILGLQIFPDVEAVTDELVLRVPDDWDGDRIVGLVERSGGASVLVMRCTEAALTDQPTRYVHAARAIAARPTSFPEVVARLFDAHSERTFEDEAREGAESEADVMELSVSDVQVQLRRTLPFTATEHARGAAIAALVTEVLGRGPDGPLPDDRAGVRPAYVVEGDEVLALVGADVVGRATVHAAVEGDVHPVTLRVDAGWRRRGIGTRLLVDAARLAQSRGASEVLLRTGSNNQAVLPMVLAAGLRGRIRMAGDELTVRVPVHDVRPARTVDV